MQEFKVGDKIILTKDCFPLKKGQEYFVQINHTNAEGKFMVGDDLHIRYCTCVENWQLISPVERTIEEVRVGDITVEADNKNPAEVVEVLKNTFAYIWNDSVQWITFKWAKELGWKIKQPEEKKEASKLDIADDIMNHFLDKGAKVSREDYDYLLTKLI